MPAAAQPQGLVVYNTGPDHPASARGTETQRNPPAPRPGGDHLAALAQPGGTHEVGKALIRATAVDELDAQRHRVRQRLRPALVALAHDVGAVTVRIDDVVRGRLRGVLVEPVDDRVDITDAGRVD